MAYDDYGVYTSPLSLRKLKKVTGLLCLLCRYLETKQILRKVVSETQAADLDQFWRKEKVAYAKREARETKRRAEKARKENEKSRKEEIRRGALALLSEEQKRALGIKTEKKKRQR
jgi:predicted Holliday junction resolvase-like endonuclease